jgi:hypothetical protein
VKYTCMACQALTASGACQLVGGAKPAEIYVPTCVPPQVLVITNWKAVSQNGALPILGCEKQ